MPKNWRTHFPESPTTLRPKLCSSTHTHEWRAVQGAHTTGLSSSLAPPCPSRPTPDPLKSTLRPCDLHSSCLRPLSWLVFLCLVAFSLPPILFHFIESLFKTQIVIMVLLNFTPLWTSSLLQDQVKLFVRCRRPFMARFLPTSLVLSLVSAPPHNC